MLSTTLNAPLSIGHYLLLALFCGILYGNTMNNEYSLDDILTTYLNPKVAQGISGIPQIWTTPYMENAFDKTRTGGYRPLTMTLFAVEYDLFGRNPMISHFINVFIYTISCLILFKILTLIFYAYHPLFSFAVILLFAAHPIHTEVVASLKNREELMVFFFCTLATFAFLQYFNQKNRTKLWLLMGSLCWLAAIFAKGSMIVFAFLIPLVLYFATDTKLKKLIGLNVLLFVTGFFILILFSAWVSPGTTVQAFYVENPLVGQASLYNRFSMALYIMGYYLQLLSFPFPLLFYYGTGKIQLMGFDSIWVWLSLFFHLSMVLYAFRYFTQKHILSFVIFYYFFAISIFSNFLFILPGVIGERFAFHMVLPFVLTIVYVLGKIIRISFQSNKPIVANKQAYFFIFILALLLIPYTAWTIQRNTHWKTTLTLLEQDTAYLTQSSVAQLLYGDALFDEAKGARIAKDTVRQKKYAQKAIQQYDKAIVLDQGNGQALRHAGYVYGQLLNQPQKGIPYLTQSLRLSGSDALSWKYAGDGFKALKQTHQAIFHYEHYLTLNPTDEVIYSKLIGQYCNAKQLDKAQQVAQKMQEQIVNPTDKFYLGLGTLELALKDTVKATYYFEQAVENNPIANKKLAGLVAQYYLQQNNMEKYQYFRKIAK